MTLTASEIYRLSADKLRQLCSEEGLDTVGPVRLLRQRVMRHLKAIAMDSQQEVKTPQASVSTNLSADTIQTGHYNVNNSSHVGGSDNPVPVSVELLRRDPSLSSEEPEAILWLVYGLEYIDALGLTDDRVFGFSYLALSLRCRAVISWRLFELWEKLGTVCGNC